jgi:hypothetical protein
VTPNSGPNNADTAITIHGTGFINGVPAGRQIRFYVWEFPVQDQVIVNDTTATGTISGGHRIGPAHAPITACSSNSAFCSDGGPNTSTTGVYFDYL